MTTHAPLSCLSSVKRSNGKRPTLPPASPPTPALPPPPEVVDVTFCGDRSGSMSNSLGPTAMGEGVQTYVNEQRKTTKDTGAKINVTIVTFDHQANTWIDNQDLSTIPENFDPNETLRHCKPRGGTALVDTCVDAINAQTARVNEWMANRTADQKARNVKMHRIFAVYTDGEDTSSMRFSVKHFHDLSTEIQERDGADFFYLATGQDAIRMGATMGFCASHTMTTGTNAGPIFRSLAAATQRASSGTAPAFTKMERGVSAPTATSAPPHRPPTPVRLGTLQAAARAPFLSPIPRFRATQFPARFAFPPVTAAFPTPLAVPPPPTPATSPASTRSS